MYVFFTKKKKKGVIIREGRGGGGEMIFNSAFGELWPHYAFEVQKV